MCVCVEIGGGSGGSGDNDISTSGGSICGSCKGCLGVVRGIDVFHI